MCADLVVALFHLQVVRDLIHLMVIMSADMVATLFHLQYVRDLVHSMVVMRLLTWW